MDIVKCYEDMLPLLCLDKDKDGKLVCDDNPDRPFTINDTPVLLPYKDNLTQPVMDKNFIFHPCHEDIRLDVSLMIMAILKRVNVVLKARTVSLITDVVSTAASSSAQNKLTPSNKMLLKDIDATSPDVSKITKLALQMCSDKALSPIKVTLAKNRKIGKDKYYRVCIVTSPLLAAIENEDPVVTKILTSKRSREALVSTINAILPGLGTEEGGLSYGSTVNSCPFMQVLLMSLSAINIAMNKYAKPFSNTMYKGSIPEGMFDDQARLDKAIIMVPVSRCNSGSRPAKTVPGETSNTNGKLAEKPEQQPPVQPQAPKQPPFVPNQQPVSNQQPMNNNQRPMNNTQPQMPFNPMMPQQQMPYNPMMQQQQMPYNPMAPMNNQGQPMAPMNNQVPYNPMAPMNNPGMMPQPQMPYNNPGMMPMNNPGMMPGNYNTGFNPSMPMQNPRPTGLINTNKIGQYKDPEF